MKLRHQSWVPSFITDYFGQEFGGGRKKDEEIHGKAVKVLDLLEHAAELGHSDALYMLAKISLVRLHFVRANSPIIIIARTVPAKSLFPIRPHVKLPRILRAREDYRERFVPGYTRILLFHRLSTYRACRSSKSATVSHLCRTWRTQGGANGSGIPVLEWYRCSGRLYDCVRLV